MATPKKMFTEEQVAQLDSRRRHQIQNQVASINRLLDEGSTYDNEMRLLHERLAATETSLTVAESRVLQLERQIAEQTAKKT